MKLQIDILNFTPHDINYVKKVGTTITFPSKGNARMITQDYRQIMLVDIALVIYDDTQIEGLPPRKEGMLYIVSSIVQVNARRDDLLSPCQFERDNAGSIISCRAFKLL
jgi:hypothetical protein